MPKIHTFLMYVFSKIYTCLSLSRLPITLFVIARINIVIYKHLDYLAAPSPEAKVESHSRNDPCAKQ